MLFLLDTFVVSELRKARAGKADRNVAAWAAGKPAASMFISVVTVQELEIGVHLANGGTRPTVGPARMVGRACARLHVPDPRPVRDALIAGTALEHG
jgi:toxin FitB